MNTEMIAKKPVVKLLQEIKNNLEDMGKAARKAEARMRDRAMKRRNLTNYARWDNNA